MLDTIQSRIFYLFVWLSKDIKIRIYKTNSTCDSVWVRNLVSNIKGGTQTEGVGEQGAEENIWTE
jgi:hypothetical protein